jgi:chromosome segregation ATPase
MSSDAMLNIKEVVDRNVQYATLNDLQKKGKQRFKVMKLGQFYSLIERAVANVVERKAVDIAEKDRQAIIDESNREFKRLFKERQEELNELQRKEEELQSMRNELDAERRRRDEIERSGMQTTHEVQSLRDRLTQASTELDGERRRREEIEGRVRAEMQRVTLELESERQRRQSLEEAVQSTRQHADALGRDLEVGLREKETETQQLRSELTSVRQQLQAEQSKVAEMDQVLRIAQEKVEGGSREVAETSRAKQQLETAVRELEAQLGEARAEATALARRSEEFEARLAATAQEKGVLDQDARKLQEEHAATERARVEALQKNTEVEARLRSAIEKLAETKAKLDTTLALAQDRDRTIAEKDQIIQELRAEIARLVADRDRLLESNTAEETERTRALRDGLNKLAEQLAAEKDQHQSTMKELLEETRAQKELFNEVRDLRAQLEETKAADGHALAGLGGRLGEIQRVLEEGVPGRPGDSAEIQEQIQAAIMVGMDTIKDQLNLHVEGINEKQRKAIEMEAVEAATVALDRLFLDSDEIKTNVEVVEVRQRKGTGIGDNLAKLKALKAAASVEDDEGEDS